MLVRYRESNSLMDAINLDLTYAVQFNLALCVRGRCGPMTRTRPLTHPLTQYEMNGMDKEALSTFSMLVKNKQYPHSQRLRANMGNIYFRQGKYSMAIRMYRMALDQIPNTCQEVRDRILRNISNAHVRSGEYQQAINSLEIIMDGPNAGAQCSLSPCECMQTHPSLCAPQTLCPPTTWSSATTRWGSR